MTDAGMSLSALFQGGFNEEAVEASLAQDARLQSAMTSWTSLKLRDAIRLIVAETTVITSPTITDVFRDDDHEAIVIAGQVKGEPGRQLLLAKYDASRKIIELTSYFKFMRSFTGIRETVRSKLENSVPCEVWDMPVIEPDDGHFHESIRNFEYADDLVFNSPVLRTGATPEPAAYHVLNHASSVYGVRNWSDFLLLSDNKRLRFFEADMKGEPMSMANVLTFDGEVIKEIVSFSRPWHSALALYTRVKARIAHDMGDQFFWPDQADYDAYRERLNIRSSFIKEEATHDSGR